MHMEDSDVMLTAACSSLRSNGAERSSSGLHQLPIALYFVYKSYNDSDYERIIIINLFDG